MSLKYVVYSIAIHAMLLLRTAGAIEPHAEEPLELPLSESDRQHWAFQKLEWPTVPEVQNRSWIRNPIDSFILAKLEADGLTGSPPASANVLLRRVHFDLVGLPPPVELVESTEHQDAPQLIAAIVDDLLASQAYGERWAQHWLDLVRFAETDGFEHDRVRSDAWRYRQWVVDALNADVPYDQFVSQQIIGDLDEDPSNDIATMFCLAGPDMPDINDQDLRRHDKLNDIASMIGPVLLGLQTHCAQCHDHKYDPISEADFYRLRGIFESAIPDMVRDRHVLQLAEQAQPQSPALYRRGELANRGTALSAKPLRIASTDAEYAAFDSTRPRQAFVQSLFHENNPLVARVIANRVWQHHFGKSLAENPSDFGLSAGEPSHPELLDWLAMELIRSGWSLKHLHRIILDSSTYQQASFDEDQTSATFSDAIEKDPDNHLYSRYPRWRLEGEAIRDSLLFVSGKLNRTYGGQSVHPPLPKELEDTLLQGQWKPDDDLSDHYRRSIYVFARRNLRYPIFETFDRPDAVASCPIRNSSTTAIQSLELLNGPLAIESSAALCDSLLASNSAQLPYAAILDQLFLRCFGRHPSEQEKSILVSYFQIDPSDFAARLRTVCHSILNTSEFIYVD